MLLSHSPGHAWIAYRWHIVVWSLLILLVNTHSSKPEKLTCKPVLVPARPLPQQSFEAVTIPTSATTSQQVYHVPDDEIDFATYLQRPLPAGVQNSAGVKWKAHWLAVEGVQPAIPENPPPNARAGRELSVYPDCGVYITRNVYRRA